jgi:hypothetical protein
VGQRTESRLPSEQVIEHLELLLKGGNYLAVAAAMSGVSESAIHSWLQEAKRPDARPRVQQIARRIHEARAFFEAAMLQVVVRAAHSGDWRAAGFFLERSAPRR